MQNTRNPREHSYDGFCTDKTPPKDRPQAKPVQKRESRAINLKAEHLQPDRKMPVENARDAVVGNPEPSRESNDHQQMLKMPKNLAAVDSIDVPVVEPLRLKKRASGRMDPSSRQSSSALAVKPTTTDKVKTDQPNSMSRGMTLAIEKNREPVSSTKTDLKSGAAPLPISPNHLGKLLLDKSLKPGPKTRSVAESLVQRVVPGSPLKMEQTAEISSDDLASIEASVKDLSETGQSLIAGPDQTAVKEATQDGKPVIEEVESSTDQDVDKSLSVPGLASSIVEVVESQSENMMGEKHPSQTVLVTSTVNPGVIETDTQEAVQLPDHDLAEVADETSVDVIPSSTRVLTSSDLRAGIRPITADEDDEANEQSDLESEISVQPEALTQAEKAFLKESISEENLDALVPGPKVITSRDIRRHRYHYSDFPRTLRSAVPRIEVSPGAITNVQGDTIPISDEQIHLNRGETLIDGTGRVWDRKGLIEPGRDSQGDAILYDVDRAQLQREYGKIPGILPWEYSGDDTPLAGTPSEQSYRTMDEFSDTESPSVSEADSPPMTRRPSKLSALESIGWGSPLREPKLPPLDQVDRMDNVKSRAEDVEEEEDDDDVPLDEVELRARTENPDGTRKANE